MTGMKGIALLAVCGMVAGATAAVSDIASFVDAPRTYNDFGGSTLAFSGSYSPNAGMVSIDESNYGSGGFANRHMAWYGDAGAAVDFDYGDGWDMKMTMRVNTADSVGNVEAGYQFDLFGFGLFGVLTTTGEIAAFGSVMPFHSFGQGLYNVGDEIMLRMIHRPGESEGNLSDKSTMEYMYNNLTTGSGWVTSGEIDYTTNEGGIPSSFPFYVGAGSQINQPDATLGHANIEFYDMMIPAPASLALLGLGGLVATRRR